MKLKTSILLLFALLTALLSGCAPPPPNHVESICSIFKQYPTWYWDAQKTQKKWGIPIPVLMAVIYQESRFNATAKPPRQKLLWIIPWTRPTSAYGYSQAIDQTWKHYKRDTGKTFASRDAFGAAADFIGWYANQAHRRAGISKANAYQVYLAYHEGIGGYMRGTYRNKQWLIHVANKVAVREWIYKKQLLLCQSSLPKEPWWRVW
ncbi:MAG: transglycosylase SLT domain-containing protein [Pseudomonadota bacterium]|nr:transglycosylase SLT domain-containing protein [Gammaproteobacteria bacterium]MBU1628642.1 transglycosylase SLT domain-containing protein [Gammaproteobacteria bacterium]MBU1926414.1 transglycosylase SLT domain-containing protein [Gammaproteobacteria bacterium]MBU2545768.1 transglycosylase SLT domain-containing protein [Gammaproteobacteria bacterium]